MKQSIKSTLMISALCALLCSCGQTKAPVEESLSDELTTTAVTETAIMTETLWLSHGHSHGLMDISFEVDDVKYRGAGVSGEIFLQELATESQTVEIPSHIAGHGSIRPWYFALELDCPNLRELTIGKKHRTFLLPGDSSDLFRAEKLTLDQSFLGFTEEYIDPKSYRDDPLRTPFPTGFAELREICVKYEKYGDPIWTTDGMLYAMRTLGTNSQSVLVCLPRNYPSENGTVTLPERTAIIQTHAIWQCRNIDRLIIPKAVGKIDPEGIVATAERPLTVVCAKDSAADEYVRLYGEQFHLTVEYLPEP